MTPQELVKQFGRARLWVDNTCGYAMIGPNIQEGECEFVEAEDAFPSQDELRSCARRALNKLRERLDLPELSYYTDDSFWNSQQC